MTFEQLVFLKCTHPLVSTTTGREDTHNHHQHHRTQINNDKEEGDHSQGQDAPHPPVPPSAGETNTLAQSILSGNIIFLMQGLKALVAFLLNESSGVHNSIPIICSGAGHFLYYMTCKRILIY